jgi:hypothetical protein
MDTEAFAMILLLAGLLVYLLPMIIVALRDVQGGAAGGVVLINLLIGWTLIGWLVAFIWACRVESPVRRKRAARNRAAIPVAGANRKPSRSMANPSKRVGRGPTPTSRLEQPPVQQQQR